MNLKRFNLVFLIIAVSFVLPATPISTAPTDNLITIPESKLLEIITKKVNEAVDAAVTVAVKDEKIKYLDLQLKYDLLVIDKRVVDDIFANYKKDSIKSSVLVGAVSFSVGLILGIIIPAIIHF